MSVEHDDVYGLAGAGPRFVRQFWVEDGDKPASVELAGRIDRFGGAASFRVRASFRLVRAGAAGAEALQAGANVHDEAGLARAVHKLAAKVAPETAQGWAIRLATAGPASSLFDAAAKGGCGCGGCVEGAGIAGWLTLGLAAKPGKFTWSDPVPVALAAAADPVEDHPSRKGTGHVTWNCQSDWYGFWPWNHITLCDGLCPPGTPACSCNRAKQGRCRGWWYCVCR